MYHWDWQTMIFAVFVGGLVVVALWVVWERLRHIEDEPADDGRPIICVDFDGVLHSFRSGWCGITEIPDEPVPGAIVWLQRLLDYGGAQVCIHGYRSRTRAGREAMRAWLMGRGMPPQSVEAICWPEHKPAATISIDDRSYRFEGDYWPSPQWLAAFKAWWERPERGEVEVAEKSALMVGVADCGKCGGPSEFGWYDGGDRRNRYRAHYFCRACGQSCADVTPAKAKRRWNDAQTAVCLRLDKPA